MNGIDVAIAVVGSFLALVHILYHAEFWQRKEYRLDRVKSVLISAENQSLLRTSFIVGMLLVALAWGAQLIGQPHIVYVLAGAYLLLHLGLAGEQVIKRGVLRPDFTFKAIALVIFAILSVVTYIEFFFSKDVPVSLNWATLLLFLPYIFAVCVALINIPFALRKKHIINQATLLRQSLRHLKAVGITGSFGKTSTKYFLEQILEGQSGVAVTHEHRNSVVAVAQDMLRQLTPETSIYIAEMGAYRKGEIKELAELVRPHIGVITGIGNQHLALFGSTDKLLAAKWELIDLLPNDGYAILNADDANLRVKATTSSKNITWFSAAGTGAELKVACAVWVEKVTVAAEHIRALLHINDEEKVVLLPLLSEALLPSALAAATAALELGVSSQDIFLALERLRPYAQTMEKRVGPHESFVIDDSYSANEQGVLIALRHLQRFSNKKKILVFRPLEELGREGAAVHERIGKAIAASGIDTVFIVNRNYEYILKKAIGHSSEGPLVFISHDAADLAKRIHKTLSGNSVILLEGRMPDVVRKSLIV